MTVKHEEIGDVQLALISTTGDIRSGNISINSAAADRGFVEVIDAPIIADRLGKGPSGHGNGAIVVVLQGDHAAGEAAAADVQDGLDLVGVLAAVIPAIVD